MDIERIEKEVRKPATKRGKRFLEKRAPKIDEGPKQTIFVRGNKTSDCVNNILKDLVHNFSKNIIY